MEIIVLLCLKTTNETGEVVRSIWYLDFDSLCFEGKATICKYCKKVVPSTPFHPSFYSTLRRSWGRGHKPQLLLVSNTIAECLKNQLLIGSDGYKIFL